MIVFIDVVIGVLYVLYIGLILFGWLKKSKGVKDVKTTKPRITVIIPVRNEASNIYHLLKDLEAQSYTDFEIVVIDDESSDNTKEIVEAFIEKTRFRIVLLDKPLKENGGHKKVAINHGIKNSIGDIIVTTDGDCRVPKKWLESIANAFLCTEVKLVSGPVSYLCGKSVFQRLQMIEFSSLISVGASTMNLGIPTMCNGANLSFRRSAFLEVGGYKNNQKLNSGDDEFLMHEIYKKHPKGVVFLKDKNAIVKTAPNSTWKEFKNQRIRWSSKWKYYKLINSKILSITVFLMNSALLIMFCLSLCFTNSFWWGLGLLGLKILSDYILLTLILRFFGEKLSPFLFLLTELFHIFYVLYFSILAQKSRYTWKGRELQ